MKKDEKKLEDKEKENDELMSDLEQLQKEVENYLKKFLTNKSRCDKI